jgi:hypothetical protein
MKKLSLLLILTSLAAIVYSQCPDTPEWNFDTDLECWTLTQNLTGGVVDGVLNLTITGNDPFMHSQTGLAIDASESWEIILGMKNNTADISGQVYFTTQTAGWSQDLSRSFTIVPNDDMIREYRIDMSIVPAWNGTIEQIRMDPLADVGSGTIEIDYIIVSGPDCEKQYITFTPVENKTIYDDPFSISATSTSGLAVDYSLKSGPATLDASLVTLTGETGVVVLAANQAGDETYCSAKEVNMAFFINDTITSGISNFYDYSDQWMVTDALGRTLPDYKSTGPEREDKLVGVFYYVWQGTHGQTVLDITEILKDPEAEPQWGGVGEFHWWGEPEQGYHRSEDPWVIRRDLQMLSNAKVDFMFFDVTNAVTYLDVIDKVCEVSMQMRSEGIPTPEICFLTNSSSGYIMNKLFDQFYAAGKYQDLWFFWDGKPLIMGHEDDPDLQAHVKDFFTIKFSWAWTNTTAEPNHWQWLDRYPQDWGWSEAPEIPEQISVSVAHHPSNPLGKSYHDGAEPPVNEAYETEFTDYGYQFAEQWSRALEVDPEVVMITQWNEWIAQRAIWDQGIGTYGGRPISNGDSYFVDVFSKEFNRDIAPMKEGYTDNYYYQMLSYIRQYKGMEAPQEFSIPKSIQVDGNFTEWEDVTPSFEDPVGDVVHRNFRGYQSGSMYVNETGRNDIIQSRVSFDADSLYFYVKTAESMTASTDALWMLLLVDADRSTYTGWEGYDYMVMNNTEIAGSFQLTRWDGSSWITFANVHVQVNGNQMELALLREQLGMDQTDPAFFFKWADNPVELSDISTFFMNGDAAPDRRFKYHFGTTLPDPIPQTPYKDHQVPGDIQFEDFDYGDAGLAYVDADLANQGGKYREAAAVDIGKIVDGEFFVGWTHAGEWLEYSMTVNAVGKFSVGIDYASENGGQKAILTMDGKPVSDTIVFPASGGTDSWTTLDNLFVSLTAGSKVLGFHILEAEDDLLLDKINISEEEVEYPGEGSGLFRSLWTAQAGGRGWFEDSLCGEIDPFLEHFWEESPGCGLDDNYWNARWEGQLEPLFSEEYTFYLTVDDMAKVWLNDTLFIDAWSGGLSGVEQSDTIELEAGVKVPIRIDFAQAQWIASMKLEWESANNSREVIPMAQLFPAISSGVGRSSLDQSESIQIYPNPVKELLTISPFGQLVLERITIYDMEGRMVYDKVVQDGGNIRIRTRTWNEGLYVVKLKSTAGVSVRKIVVQ